MHFHIGQKVVYAPKNEGIYRAGTIMLREVGDTLVKRCVYVVRWTGTCDFCVPPGIKVTCSAIRLVGIRRDTQPQDMRDTHFDVPYGAMHFEPVEEIEDSCAIKLFRKIAADATAAKKITVTGPKKISK